MRTKRDSGEVDRRSCAAATSAARGRRACRRRRCPSGPAPPAAGASRRRRRARARWRSGTDRPHRAPARSASGAVGPSARPTSAHHVPSGCAARRQAVHEHHEVVEQAAGRRVERLDRAPPARDVVAERLQQQAEGAVEVKAVAAAPALDDPLGGLGVVDRRRPAALDLEVLEDDALEVAGLQLGQRVRRRRAGRLEAQPREVVGDRDAALGERLLSPSCRRRGRRHPRGRVGCSRSRRAGGRAPRSRSRRRDALWRTASTPLGRGDEADQPQLARAVGLQAGQRGDRAAAGGQHRVQQEDVRIAHARAAGARSSPSAPACPRRAACPR